MHRIFAGVAAWTMAALAGEFVLGWFVSRAFAEGRLGHAQHLFTWHMMLGLVLGTLCTALHVMTMFHFIGSGREIKDHAEVLGERAAIVARVRRFKALTFPFATFAPLVTGAAVILGGGAHMKWFPGWIHWAVGLAAVALNLAAFPIEYKCLRLNLELIEEVDAKIRREVAPPMFREPQEAP
jgi:hypothetical protein